MCLVVNEDGEVMVETSEAEVVCELLLPPTSCAYWCFKFRVPWPNSMGSQGRGKRGKRGNRQRSAESPVIAPHHCDSNDAPDVDSEGDHPRTISVDENVINIHNLRGVIAKCNDDDSYNINYKNGWPDEPGHDINQNVVTRLIGPYIPPPDM